jgi:[acyl-carrier-protein] S-malonyltransferase
MKQTAIVVCPGRGTYNAPELGYLQKYHGGGGALVAQLDAMRVRFGQMPISALDSAASFSPSMHMTGDNASLLIYACAMADFAAIDRDRYDIVGVTGNSMGWYLALAASGALDLAAGARLVNTMGGLMHEKGVGGQIVWSLMDDSWHISPAKQQLAAEIVTEAHGRADINVHVSIRLGGMIVFAADDAGLKWLISALPKDDRFPMRLNYHAAFHSPLLDFIVPEAQHRNSSIDFGQSFLPLIDGDGRVWSPRAYDPLDIYAYTLGRQINRTYDFTRAVQVAAKEFAPDKIIILGPGTTLGAPTAQALIAVEWRGIKSKDEFIQRQNSDPIVLAMGIESQRGLAIR